MRHFEFGVDNTYCLETRRIVWSLCSMSLLEDKSLLIAVIIPTLKNLELLVVGGRGVRLQPRALC
jgi:hypothetical protein